MLWRSHLRGRGHPHLQSAAKCYVKRQGQCCYNRRFNTKKTINNIFCNSVIVGLRAKMGNVISPPILPYGDFCWREQRARWSYLFSLSTLQYNCNLSKICKNMKFEKIEHIQIIGTDMALQLTWGYPNKFEPNFGYFSQWQNPISRSIATAAIRVWTKNYATNKGIFLEFWQRKKTKEKFF